MIEKIEFVQTVKTRKRFFHLGLPMLLVNIAQAMTVPVLTDLIVYHTCLISMNINATNCLMLRNDSGSPESLNLETKIEPYASVIVMSNFLIKSILPAIVALFMGPWSDRGGRRPLFLAAMTGMTLTFGTLALICNWNINPWYLLLALIPANIVGGMHIVKLAFVCHISDTTTDKDRILQLALLDAAVYGGYVLGGLSGSFIYKNYGYTYIFAAAAVCCILALAYSCFYIHETVKNTSTESIHGIFKLSFVRELIASILVQREGFHRPIVWLAITCITINALVMRGDVTIKFLFTRASLGWDVQQYSYFDAAEAFFRMFGLCGVYFRSKVSGGSNTLLASISFISSLGGAITKSLAWKSWHMYLAVCIAIFTGITIPVMRSVISKFVPAGDVGKVFSLTSILDILSSSCGPAIFTLIYSHYLPPIYPSPVFLVSVGLYAIPIILVFFIEILIRNLRNPSSQFPAIQQDKHSSLHKCNPPNQYSLIKTSVI